MMNKYKKGELVIVNGKGKNFGEQNTNVLGIIKEKDYYFNTYLVEILFGKDDWFKEKDLTRTFEKKNRKIDKYKVGLALEIKGLNVIKQIMQKKDEKTINLLLHADLFQKFTVDDKQYLFIVWSETYWPETNYTVQAIEEALPILKKENIPYQYIVVGITNPQYVKIDEFVKNDKNVDILEISTKIKIKKFGGVI